MNNFKLNDWLRYLENLHFEEIKLGLDRIRSVAQSLNVLDFNSKIILIAGTNGKGSTIGALEKIYLQSGYTVGVYTSPHLIKFNERIRLNNQNIQDEVLCSLFYEIELNRNDIVLSYFEITTLAALLYFKRLNPDIILLEAGMGGRLDATNIVNPDLSIITTVDFDHQKYLGNNLETIGKEKAGIMRKGATCIYADDNPPDSIEKKAAEINSTLLILNKHFSYRLDNQNVIITTPKNRVICLSLPLINVNALCSACIAVECLENFLPVKFNTLENIFYDFVMPGRLHLITGKINILFDVSHNVQAVTNLVKFIQNRNFTGTVHAIFSALQDKDLCGLISLMKPVVHTWFAVELKSKRASKKEDLIQAFKEMGILNANCFDLPLNAFESALDCAKMGDLIVIYGSFNLIGSMLAQVTKIKSLINGKINEIET